MLGEHRWSCRAMGERPVLVVLPWGHQVFAERALQGGHLEDRGGEGEVVCLGDCSAPRGRWLCLETGSVVTTGGLHLVGRGQGTAKHPSTYRMSPECCGAWGRGTRF